MQFYLYFSHVCQNRAKGQRRHHIMVDIFFDHRRGVRRWYNAPSTYVCVKTYTQYIPVYILRNAPIQNAWV